ncbi:hypothetical protein J5N97_020168 [Dioscorea zingiberensis]|uniref:GDSL esterase/lipase n=1 Tax=Dioscorea zingiberensis TaxID=325984 RepID=A0A9D5CG40_9LILI|nr:hypothetical protein J5N97_020168 [Dioscorea zingiberensis]
MATLNSSHLVFSITVLVLITCFFFSITVSRAQDVGGDAGGRRELVPAMFVFGDSLIDNGNNNNLPSFAKANYFPYGIDFVAGPTGRFSNGYTIVDEIANLLGLPLTPAYSEAAGSQIFHGVNYASAAAGILDSSGGNFTPCAKREIKMCSGCISSLYLFVDIILARNAFSGNTNVVFPMNLQQLATIDL